MCEHFVARAAEPFRLDELWPFTERLERYGIAGFGWGAAWLTPDGGSSRYRDIRAFRDDPGRDARRRHRDDERPRPSPPALEALDPQLARHPAVRRSRRAASRSATTATSATARRAARRYRAAGPDPRPRRHRGRRSAGSRTRWDEDDPPAARSCDAPRAVRRPGEPRHARRATAPSPTTPATPRTRCSRSASGGSASPSTGLYSLDRSLFRFAAPGATDRRLVRVAAP